MELVMILGIYFFADGDTYAGATPYVVPRTTCSQREGWIATKMLNDWNEVVRDTKAPAAIRVEVICHPVDGKWVAALADNFYKASNGKPLN